MTGTEDTRPVLRIVKGDATPEEVAALVAVVTAIGAASSTRASGRPPSAWSSHHRKLRAPLSPGWRSSALPR